MTFFLIYILYTMNEIVNTFLLAGDKFMPEMHLKQPVSACGPFTKNKERIKKCKQEIQIILTGMILIRLVFNNGLW